MHTPKDFFFQHISVKSRNCSNNSKYAINKVYQQFVFKKVAFKLKQFQEKAQYLIFFYKTN